MPDPTLQALSDDQLVGLLRDVLQECATRTVAVHAAAQAVGLEEAEKLRIAKEAAAKARAKSVEQERREIEQRAAEQAEAAKQAELWAAKRAIASDLALILGKPAALQIWSKAETGERRIYVDTDPFGKRNQKFCLFVTGNQRHAPNSYETDMTLLPGQLMELVGLCQRVARDWSSIRIPKEAYVKSPV